MFNSYLMPLDCSEQAEQIGKWIIRIAESFDSRVTLLGVVAPRTRVLGDVKAQRAETQKYLDAVIGKSATRPGNIRTQVALGRPAAEILKVARSTSSEAIALCTRRASTLARTILGSVTDQVLRNAEVPVLVANQHCVMTLESSPDVPKVMIVPLDGSGTSEQVLPTAFRLAKAAGARLIFLRSSSAPFSSGSTKSSVTRRHLEEYLLPFEEQAKSMGIEASSETPVGTAARCIMERSDGLPGSLIIMTTHGHTGFRRAVLGSVTNQVVRFAPTPVLVVPQRGD